MFSPFNAVRFILIVPFGGTPSSSCQKPVLFFDDDRDDQRDATIFFADPSRYCTSERFFCLLLGDVILSGAQVGQCGFNSGYGCVELVSVVYESVDDEFWVLGKLSGLEVNELPPQVGS